MVYIITSKFIDCYKFELLDQEIYAVLTDKELASDYMKKIAKLTGGELSANGRMIRKRKGRGAYVWVLAEFAENTPLFELSEI